MVRRKSRMDALCRGLRKYLFLPEDTCRDKRLQCLASPCWVMASPTANRFDRTTFSDPGFSLGESTIGIAERPRLEIAEQLRRSFFRDAPGSGEDRRTICNSDQAGVLR